MTPPKDDRRGVFVPLWAMEDCDGDARDAMVLAQITWWLQPAQRDGRRRTVCIVDRDGESWLTLTDAELGEDIGMTRDQVGRARRKLAAAGLIVSKSGSVDGRKVTLTTSPRADDQSAEAHNAESGSAQTKVQDRTDVCAGSHDALSTKTEETKSTDRAATGVAVSPEIEALCVHLADRIERHRDGVRPTITAKWRKDMRLLVERGPLHVDGAQGISPDKVRASIDSVFDELAVPDGRTGFCWADQIRSAGNLRDKWAQLREAYRRATGSRVGRGAQAVDRVARKLAGDGADSSRQPLGLLIEHEPKELGA